MWLPPVSCRCLNEPKKRMEKSKGSGVRQDWEGILPPRLLVCVTLIKLLHLSELLWPHLWNKRSVVIPLSYTLRELYSFPLDTELSCDCLLIVSLPVSSGWRKVTSLFILTVLLKWALSHFSLNGEMRTFCEGYMRWFTCRVPGTSFSSYLPKSDLPNA